MSIFDPKSIRYKEQQRSQAMREEAMTLIEAETEFFHQRVKKEVEAGGEKMDAMMEEYGRALTRELLTIVRGAKQRTEQLGESVVKMSALAKQAWDATQVTIDAVSKQSIRANKAALSLKNSLATRGSSDLRNVASSIDPSDFGWHDAEMVNNSFASSARAMVRHAREEAAQGRANTPDTQADKVLNHIMTQHADQIADLPSVKEAVQLRTVPDMVDTTDGGVQ